MIEVEGLSKRYGDHTAVENISFRAEKGQILGFLGPNGAGKTTTMRMLTCYLPPSEGRASVAGFDVVEESLEVRRRIGYLPEQPPLYTDMTVDAYLRFVAKIKGVPTPQLNARLDETMEKAGIAHVRDSIIGQLSKGYRQRVGLGQALVHNPDVLILDEPTVGLDPKQIIEIREVIKGLGGDHTVILSTHILPEVSVTCEKIVVINNGRIAGEGTPDSLKAQLGGGEGLRLRVAGPPAEVTPVLQAVEGVQDVTVEGPAADEANYVVAALPGSEIRDRVAKAVIDAGYGLRELRVLEMTLEDIFLRLTTEEVNG